VGYGQVSQGSPNFFWAYKVHGIGYDFLSFHFFVLSFYNKHISLEVFLFLEWDEKDNLGVVALVSNCGESEEADAGMDWNWVLGFLSTSSGSMCYTRGESSSTREGSNLI